MLSHVARGVRGSDLANVSIVPSVEFLLLAFDRSSGSATLYLSALRSEVGNYEYSPLWRGSVTRCVLRNDNNLNIGYSKATLLMVTFPFDDPHAAGTFLILIFPWVRCSCPSLIIVCLHLPESSRASAHDLSLADELGVELAAVEGEVDVEIDSVEGALRRVHALEVLFEVFT